ncbi:hypothetical protein BIW11_04270 [Tropilaelaps mercedesae]|uniref:Uncharacterized protein n=1 Tax=Tropilaelaps mercedesae TaxID=418985 RepID=A0A1V9X8L8_9ACAR|nr:hypothetical protein BIW11_04270 [Tropilaelaps mercedesae]
MRAFLRAEVCPTTKVSPCSLCQHTLALSLAIKARAMHSRSTFWWWTPHENKTCLDAEREERASVKEAPSVIEKFFGITSRVSRSRPFVVWRVVAV